MDIAKDFEHSLHVLSHHKRIVLPVIGSIILPLFLLFVFLNFSGLQPLLSEYATLSAEFEKEREDYLLNPENVGDQNYFVEMQKYMNRNGYSEEQEFESYLEFRGYDFSRFRELLTLGNFVLLFVLVAVGLIGSLYFSSMSYAIIALTLHRQKITLNGLISVTNKFLLKLFSLRVVIASLVILPIVIMIGIIASLLYLQQLLGIISAIILLVLFIGYIIYLAVRLLFVTPAMYLGGKGAIGSVKHSYHITKHHIRQAFLLFVVIWGFNIFLSSFIGDPLTISYGETVLGTDAVRVLVNFVVLGLFVLVEGFVFTFEHLFLFFAYGDFKELRGIVK